MTPEQQADIERQTAIVIRRAMAGAAADPELRIEEWAEANMVLPRSGPTGGGEYLVDRTPYARRVMQVLAPSHPCKRVVARVASQMFKTQVAINWICAIAHLAPANILALQPTEGLARRFSRRMSLAIGKIDVLKNVFAAERSRNASNTTAEKSFHADSTLYINTAGAAANLAEISARYVFLDEVDRLLANVDGEGDPVDIAEARATQFDRNAKFYEVSSPTIKGFSKIDALHDMGTQEVYEVPCPHCDHLHELVQENFHYEHDPDTGYVSAAWFVCPECGGVIREADKAYMLPDVEMGGKARWVAKSRGDGETISFSLSAFYMPFGAITWVALARQHAKAKARLAHGDHAGMQVYYNTRLGLSYLNSESTHTSVELQKRAEPYAPRTVPERALVLTMAVDTQANRLEYQIEAWGPGMEHWVIDYGVLMGSPTVPPETPGSVWHQLDEIRRTPFPHEGGGRPILISTYGIDSGGSNTQDVYNYGTQRIGANCTVLHGATRPNRPVMGSVPSRVDLDWGGKKTAGGVELWTVGTDVAKDYLHARLGMESGPGAMHFHALLPPEWFEGMVVEQPRMKYERGRSIRKWINPPGGRNEPWDCSVYNLALAYRLGLHRWVAADWDRLRDKLCPPGATLDLFSPPVSHPPPPPPLPEGAVDAAVDKGAGVSTQVFNSERAESATAVLERPAPAAAAPPPPPPAPPPPPPPPAPYTGRRTFSRGVPR